MMTEFRMDGVTVSGSIQFEAVPLETYNELIALLFGLKGKGEAKTEPIVPPHKEADKPVKPRLPREERAVRFGAKLREMREKHELSRKELGALIGYSPITIGTWEIGAATPSNLAVDELRKCFNTDEFEYLLPKEK